MVPAYPVVSFCCDILLSFSLAMGFCSPAFMYYAHIRTKLLGRVLKPAGTDQEAEDLREIETELRSFTIAARIGLPLGIFAGFVYFYR